MGDNGDGRLLLVSHLTLRRTVGALGVLLPFILAGGCLLFGSCGGLQPSISEYYDTEMRDVLVGVLFTIGWFLFAYKGYDRRDDVAGDLACAFALGIALFPITSTRTATRVVHLFSATCLFLVLAYFSIVLFRKTKSPGVMTQKKRVRNRIYLWCGIAILACIGGIVLYAALPPSPALAALEPVFWLEALALVAFGVSWFVKGETLWTDEGTS
jgi:hypothetical protein